MENLDRQILIRLIRENEKLIEILADKSRPTDNTAKLMAEKLKEIQILTTVAKMHIVLGL